MLNTFHDMVGALLQCYRSNSGLEETSNNSLGYLKRDNNRTQRCIYLQRSSLKLNLF